MSKFCLFVFFLCLFCASESVWSEYRPVPGSGGHQVFWVETADRHSAAFSSCVSYVDSMGYSGESRCAMSGVMDRGWEEDGLHYIAAGWFPEQDFSVLAFFLYEPKCQKPTSYNKNTARCEIRCPLDKPWDERARACLSEPTPAPGLCPDNIAGNPVNFFNGHKVQEEVVFDSAGESSIDFIWKYNSFGNDEKYGGGYIATSDSGEVLIHHENDIPENADFINLPLLSGLEKEYTGNARSRWRHNHSYYLAHYNVYGDKERFIAYRPSGRDIHFIKRYGKYVPRASLDWEVVKDIDEEGDHHGWVLKKKDGVEKYDLEGRVVRIENYFGEGFSYTYNDVEGNQGTIYDDRGNKIELHYDGSELRNVKRSDGRIYNFNYNESGMLESITFPGGGADKRVFLYEDSKYPKALTGVIDEAGTRYSTFAYDDEGRIVSSEHSGGARFIGVEYVDELTRRLTNSLGKKSVYHYQKRAGGYRISSIDGEPSEYCPASSRQYSYGVYGQPDQYIDANGVVTDFLHNIESQVIKKEYAKGTPEELTVEQVWHASLDMPMERYFYNSSGERVLAVTWTRNSRGQPLTRTETGQASRRITTSYCELEDIAAGACPLVGLVTAVDGSRLTIADVTSYGYYMADHINCSDTSACPYRRGDLHTVTNSLGQVIEILEYDGIGRPARIKNANDVVTELEYDARDRLVRRTVAAGLSEEATATFDYDAVGQLTRVTLPNGAWINYEYDAAHRLTALEDALGNRMEYTLDAAGNRIAESVSGSSGTVFRERTSDYDQLSRLVADINGVNDRTEHDYDAVGNRSATEDAASNVTTYEYDALNRLTEVTDALNGETAYEYDALDNLTQVTDPRGVMTTYDHNAFGDVLAEHSPDAGTTTYTYDAAGNRLTRTDARGVTATYSYDALNRLTGIDYPGNEEDIQYTYDQGAYGKGRLTGFADAGGTTTLTYDPRGNVLTRIRSTGGKSFMMQYEYDLADNVTAIVYPSGLRIELTRDTMGRITAVETTVDGAATGLASEIQYQPFGGITGLTYGNGLIQTRQHDLAGRLVAQTVPPVQDLSWTYSNTGNITGIQDQVTPARTQTFSYDALNRLIDASGAYGTRAYQYDAVGNRTQRTEDGQTTPYGYAPDSNRLTTIDGQSVPYDATGNILTLAGDDFTYGARNRRQTTERNGSLIAEYEYNALGQRTHKSHAGTETHFVHGRNGQLIGEYDISGQAIREYVYLEGEPLAMIHQGAVYYFHNDQLGSPLKLTDNSQNVAWDGVRAPFGEMSITTNAVENPLRFPGQYFDAETGLHQNWFRDYDPGIGRYTRSDPIGLYGGLNTYAYVGGNPLLRSDPMGLACGTGLCLGGALWVAGQLAVDATAVGAGIWVASENDQGDNLDDLLDDARDDLDDENFCHPENTPGDDCEKLYATDTATCNGISRMRGKRSGAVCHSSASERYAACLAGRPIPPLNTWNN